jgi:ABC-2 type transport system permease protein
MPVFILTTAAIQKGQMNKYYSSAAYLANPSNFGIILSWMLMLIIFLSACNFTSASSISREGADIYFLRAIPFKVFDYINSKIMASSSISFTSMMILLIPIAVYFKIPIYYFVMMSIVGTLGILFTVEIGILIDSIYPKLNWDSEQKAVMQNFNPIFSIMLVVMLSGILNAIVSVFSMNLNYAFLFLFICYAFVDAVIYCILVKKKI